MASDVTGTFGGGLNGYRACADVLPGIVGQAAAVEFAGFVKKAASEKQMRSIVDDPAGATLPDALDGIYMLTSWLAYHAEDTHVSKASAVLLSRLPPEFGVVLARDMLKARAAFAKEAGYREFLKVHGHLIQR